MSDLEWLTRFPQTLADKSKPKAEVVPPGPHTKALMKVSDEGGKVRTPLQIVNFGLLLYRLSTLVFCRNPIPSI